MIPYTHHSSPSSSGGGTSGGGDAALERIRRNEQKMQMENRIRIMKNDVVSKRRTEDDLQRDVRALEMALHHVDEEHNRISGEWKRSTTTVHSMEVDSKRLELGLREKDTELHRKEADLAKIEHEIDLLKAQVVEKERIIVLMKQDVSKLMREKEDFRREHELEHFTTRTEEGHAHEKSVRIQLLDQEKKRKEADMAHKKEQIGVIHRTIIDKEQDIIQLEAQLRRLTSGG